ncbi:hypothetical protein BDW22DRAFT_1483474 [Trametopsis cervina]|nr:hypothetical protein BDW22DRAFT_1483474 [Trametopsis cervina]
MSSDHAPTPLSPEESPFRIPLHAAEPDEIAEMLLDMYTPWPVGLRSVSGAQLLANYINSNRNNLRRMRKLSGSTLVPVIFRIIIDLRTTPPTLYVITDVGALIDILGTFIKVGADNFRLADEKTPWPHKAFVKEHLPILLDAVWMRRSVLLDAMTARDDINRRVGHLQLVIAELLGLHLVPSLVHFDLRNPAATPETFRISLYAWSHGGVRIHRMFAVQHIESGQLSDDDIRSALQNESDVFAVLRTAHALLTVEQLMNDYFDGILTILGAVFRVSALAHRVSGDNDHRRGIVELIIRACMRQACSGDEDVALRDRRFYHVGSSAFRVLRHVVSGPVSTSGGAALASVHIAHYKKVIGKANVVPLFGKLAMLSIYVPLVDDLPTVHETVNAMSTVLDFQARVVIKQDPTVTRGNTKKILLISSTWNYLLPRMLALHINDPGMKDIFARITAVWKRYGDALRLDSIAHPSATPPGSTRCAWKPCLCFQMSSVHTMKVCKGCFQVFYCTKLCQKGDWEQGGHRDVCKKLSKHNSALNDETKS